MYFVNSSILNEDGIQGWLNYLLSEEKIIISWQVVSYSIGLFVAFAMISEKKENK